jgi:hypothetical protein
MTDTVLVCGHGRCGLSMVMQMLYCGGVPCNGEWPAFEPEQTGPGMDVVRLGGWLKGRATKVIDPHLSRSWPDDIAPKIIWLSRDHEEQARSQVKFLRQVAGMRIPNSAVRRLRDSYSEDTRKCLNLFGEAARLHLAFEGILAEPRIAAEELAGFIGCGNVDAMATAVYRRSYRCAPGMDMEIALIEKGPPVMGRKQ